MDYVDYQYCMQVQNFVERFQVKSHNPYKANMRCPICGDSQKSVRKARGWLLETTRASVQYYCHNCHASIPLKGFLYQLHPDLGKGYVAAKFLEKKKEAEQPEEDTKEGIQYDFSIFKSPYVKKISSLSPDHKVKQYIRERRIPPEFHYKLFYCSHFVKFSLDLEYPIGKVSEHSRILIPWLTEKRKVFVLESRALDDKHSAKYLQFVFDKRVEPAVYGLDTVDFEKEFYVTEGSFDSMFLDNAIAMGTTTTKFDSIPNMRENGVVVLDNQNRNPEVLKQYEKVIAKGLKVVVWPEDVDQKDINDMVKAGRNVKALVAENTFQGLAAKLEFSKWRKYG